MFRHLNYSNIRQFLLDLAQFFYALFARLQNMNSYFRFHFRRFPSAVRVEYKMIVVNIVPGSTLVRNELQFDTEIFKVL